jgi:hypothetical protein
VFAEDLAPVKSLKDMDWLIGTWKVDGQLGPQDTDLGTPGTRCVTTYNLRRANQDFIIEEVTFEANGKSRKHMTALIGVDQSTKTVAMWTFRYDGLHGRSDLLSDGTVTHLLFKGMSKNGPVSSLIIWKRTGPHTFTRQFTKWKIGDRSLPDGPISIAKRNPEKTAE